MSKRISPPGKEMVSPEFTAFSNEVVIIPFKNIDAVEGDATCDPGEAPKDLSISVILKSSRASIALNGEMASQFMSEYKYYLGFLESLQKVELL